MKPEAVQAIGSARRRWVSVRWLTRRS